MFTNVAIAVVLGFHASSTLAQCMWPEEQCNAILALESSECTDYHILSARGSDAPTPGHAGEMIRQVCEGINGTCGWENVDYPANSSFAGQDAWCESAAKGASGGQKQLTDYAERCPDSKLIVVGFSQGGSVALDIVGGGGGAVFECEQAESPALDRSTVPGSNVAAAIIFGAVRRTANQTYDYGEGKPFNGKSTRSEEQLAGLDGFSDVLRNWCNFGDYMCAADSEPSGLENHLNYFDLYNEEAARWVIDTAQKSLANSSESTESASEANTKTSSGTNPQSTSMAATASSTETNARPSDQANTISGASSMLSVPGLSILSAVLVLGMTFLGS